MHESPRTAEKEEWVVWNGSMGILSMATLGRVEVGADGRKAWLAPPFDMVGPFSLDELETRGQIPFEACIVLSRQKWQDDQVELRKEAFAKRRAAQERMHAEQERFNRGRGRRRKHLREIDEKQHRETLHLPIDGKLEPSQIKAAFRRLAQKAHPDTGGSHEQFLLIKEARNALLDWIS